LSIRREKSPPWIIFELALAPQRGEVMPNHQFNLAYFSPKIEKRMSPIQGRGLFANTDVEKDEVVVVKGRYVLTKGQRDEIGKELGPSEIQITENLFIGPTPSTECCGSE
jgi:hypothetical protein